MIVEDTTNRFFSVRETGDANLAHVWFGIEVKRSKGGFVPKKNARQTLVRREGCRFVAHTLPVQPVVIDPVKVAAARADCAAVAAACGWAA